MVSPESLSQYLSNEYQCYGVSIELKNYQYFLHSDFGDKGRLPSFPFWRLTTPIWLPIWKYNCYWISYFTKMWHLTTTMMYLLWTVISFNFYHQMAVKCNVKTGSNKRVKDEWIGHKQKSIIFLLTMLTASLKFTELTLDQLHWFIVILYPCLSLWTLP
jgi:hypothetical protein